MAKRRYHTKKAYKEIGSKIRKLREAKKWTLEQTEEHGWHSWQQLQKIESGRNITVRTIINLANLFGVHPSVFLEDV